MSRAEMYCDVCGGPHVQNHTLGRLRWAARTARHAEPLTMAARVRLLWHDFVTHGLLDKGGERCQDCGRDTGWFQVGDDEWIAVMGYPSGLLCRPCFNRRSAHSAALADAPTGAHGPDAPPTSGRARTVEVSDRTGRTDLDLP